MASWWNSNPAGEFSLNPLSWTGLGAAGEVDKATGGKLSNFMFGGDATKGMPSGLANQQYMTDYAKNQLATIGDRNAPQFMSADAAAARMQQQQLADRLRQISSGQTAGAGELAVNRQVGQAVAGQQGQASAARGQNTALAGRLAARNMGEIGVNGAGQAAIAQLNDQTSANNQLAGVLGGMRQGDIGIGQGNQNAQLAQTGMNQQGQLGFLNNMLGVDTASLQQDALKRQLALQDKGIFPSLLQAGGGIMGAYAGGGMGGK